MINFYFMDFCQKKDGEIDKILSSIEKYYLFTCFFIPSIKINFT